MCILAFDYVHIGCWLYDWIIWWIMHNMLRINSLARAESYAQYSLTKRQVELEFATEAWEWNSLLVWGGGNFGDKIPKRWRVM